MYNLGASMKKAMLFLSVVLSLKSSPQSNEIDTLYYLHDSSQFIPEYAIAREIFYTHTRFYPQPTWELYKIIELNLMFRPSKIGRTIQSISFYNDTLQQTVFTYVINKVLDSSDVYPNWFKIMIDNSPNLSDYIEVPSWWGDLCEVQPEQISGNTIGFYDASQSWGVFHDLPVKLIIQKVPVEVRENFQSDFYCNLEQNYPNPFNSKTKFRYDISKGEPIIIKVYDILGNEVATLVNDYKPAGSYEVEFNADAAQTISLCSGVYYYQLRVGDPSTSSGESFVQTRKMILLR